MSKTHVFLTIICTTIVLVFGLVITNHYFNEVIETPKTSEQSIEESKRSETTLQTESIPRIVEGRIVGITDGDTVKVLTSEKKLYTIRLAGIDAPERAQDFGKKSKEYLSSLIFDQFVQIKVTKIDKYGRSLGQIYSSDKDVNLEMIDAGLAWHYKKYKVEQTEIDRQLYAEAEIRARKRKIGLWSMPNPIAPWMFRHPELSQQ